jgi:predicted nuclease with TOPRIM domain
VDGTFEKIKSNIKKNISNLHKKKKKMLSDISDMRKSLNEHLDKIEKQTDAVSRTNLTRTIKESNGGHGKKKNLL